MSTTPTINFEDNGVNGAVTHELISHDEYFIQTTNVKVILNSLDKYNINDIELINKQLMTIYNTDVLDIVPQCDCGNLRATSYLGRTCESCGTEVQEIEKKIEPFMWLETLEPSIKFINPQFYLMVRYTLDKKIDTLRWLSDHRYNPVNNNKLPVWLYGCLEIIKGVRSYNNMIDNLDKILLYLYEHPEFIKKPSKREDLGYFIEMWREQRTKILSSYIPIVNKKLFVMENTTKGKFVNLAVADVMDVVLTWINTANTESTLLKKQIDTVNVLHKLSDIYYNYYDKYILKKPGMFRKHVFGSRSPFTFRSVITSIPGPHDHQELRLPWGIACTVFDLHIHNKLRKKYSFKDANAKLAKAIKKYDSEIHDILIELAMEAPDQKIWCMAQRNPSLLQGSGQCVYIPPHGFKVDPTDNTIGISPLILKACNGDIDGDELNFWLMLDNLMYDEFKTFSPFYNVPDLSKPFSVSGNLTLLSPGNYILGNYLDDKTSVPDELDFVLEPVSVEIEGDL